MVTSHNLAYDHGLSYACPRNEQGKEMPIAGQNPLLTIAKIVEVTKVARCGSLKLAKRDRALLFCLCLFGARISEVLSLRKGDFVFPANEADGAVFVSFHTAKNKKQKTRRLSLPFRPFAKQFFFLKEYVYALKEPESPLFEIKVNMAFKLVKYHLGKNYFPHWFRHNMASFLATKFSSAMLQQFFGWSGIESSEPYMHLNAWDASKSIQEMFSNEDNAPQPIVKTPQVVLVERKPIVPMQKPIEKVEEKELIL
jgi:integrase